MTNFENPDLRAEDDFIIDVSGNADIPINFGNSHDPEIVNSFQNQQSEKLATQYDPDYWKIGKKYTKKLNLSENQIAILDTLRFAENVFNEIDYCKVQILKQFLRTIEFLHKNCIPVNKSYATVIDELSEIIIVIQYNYRKESLNYKYTYDSIQAEIFNHILKLCENSVREVYGIKRKINTDFNYTNPDILDKYNRKIVEKVDAFLIENQHCILDADAKTNIILNENNTNRWKTKFELIKEDYNNPLAFEREIFRLADVNIKNPSVDSIFFEASKFVADFDKSCALRLYLHHLDKALNLKSDNKQLTKTIQKSLFSTKEQISDFEKIMSDFIAQRNLETAIQAVNKFYEPKRKKISINQEAIENVQRLDSEISRKLGDILSDDYEDENTSIKAQELQNTTEITFSITHKNQEIQISKYLDEFNFTNIQKEILDLFEKQSFNILQTEFLDFIKSKNLFMGSAIDAINDTCYETLDDILIEEEDEYFTINPNYYKKLLNND
jgi:hypothetical protein